ncbi:MAG: flagellar filament capping protein FliD [Solirubrobacterales bacterium]|nr:flagellar filament capping protein FliD [Solirubrobacterales bacterium]
MTGIRLTGLVSGLDTDSIVSQLMALERQPRTRTELQQSAVNARKSGLSDVQTKLNALKYAAADLRAVGVWADTQSVDSNDPTKVSARRLSGAGPGAYDVVVTSLASSERVTYSGWSAPASATQIEIRNKDGSLRTAVDIAAGATLDDVVSAINSKPEAKVYAVNVEGKLVLAAKETGKDAAFSAVGAGTEDSRVPAENAVGTVGTTPFEKQSNVISGIIPGLEVTLKGKTTGTTITVGGPEPDRDAVKGKVKAFVEKYNAVLDTLRTDLDEKKVANAANATDASKGQLFGDSGLRDILARLRSTAGLDVDPTADADTYDNFASIGVSTGSASSTINADSVKGKLVLDEAKLDAALDADPLAVQRLLGGVAGTDGLAQAFESVISPLTQADGVLDGRIKAADTELARIKASLARFDDRLTSKEEAYRKKFTALESALQRSQSIQSDLAARLSAMGL